MSIGKTHPNLRELSYESYIWGKRKYRRWGCCRLIAYPLEAQSAGGGDLAGGATVVGFQDGGDGVRLPAALADVCEGADDVADHVVEEAVAFDVDIEIVGVVTAFLADVTAEEGAYGALALVRSGGKGTEVVLADEVLGGLLHGGDV